MRRYVLAVVLASCLASLHAESGHLCVYTVREGQEWRFPLLEHPSDTAVSRRMNDFMQLALLQKLIRPGDARPFAEALYNPGNLYGGIVSIDYRVTTNTPRVFSIVFDLASSGMTMHYWRVHFMFNAATGELIHEDDLFTPEGKERFMRLATKRMIAHADAVIDSTYRDEFPGWYAPINAFDLDGLYLKKSRLYLDRFSQLSKNEQFAGDPTISFSAAELDRHLTDYGKAVLGSSSTPMSDFRSGTLPQLWSGCVDESYPIIVILRPDPEELRGVYCYTRYGLGIDLAGELVDGVAVLKERDRDLNDKAEINGRLETSGFMGTWNKLPNGKELAFAAWPMGLAPVESTGGDH